ncbi:MAG: histidine phosphatase family protein [Thiolinea sp.]
MTPDDPAAAVTHVDLIRHGRVQTPGLFCAAPDEPLSAEGVQQLQRVTQALQPDVILTSPSVRCAAFARELAQRLNCPLQVEAAFQEMQFGRWVGQSTAALWAQEADVLQQLWTDPETFVAPGGEALTAFAGRVRDGWARLLAQHAGQQVLVFTHGGVIRVLLAQALGIAYRQTLALEPGYGTATRLRVYADGAMSVYGMGCSCLDS